MKWEGHRESDNVEDRRAGGLPGGIRLGGGRGIGLGTIVIALIAGWIFGINPLALLGVIEGGGPMPAQQAPATAPPANDAAARFVSVVLADTEDVWRAQFQQRRQQLSRAAAGAVPRRDPDRLRHRSVGDGAVLLPR